MICFERDGHYGLVIGVVVVAFLPLLHIGSTHATWKDPTLLIKRIDDVTFRVDCDVQLHTALEKPQTISLETTDANNHDAVVYTAFTGVVSTDVACTNSIRHAVVTDKNQNISSGATVKLDNIVSPFSRYRPQCCLSLNSGQTYRLSITVYHVQESDLCAWKCTYVYRNPATPDTSIRTLTKEVVDVSLLTERILPPLAEGQPDDGRPKGNETFIHPQVVLLSHPGDIDLVFGCKVNNFKWSQVSKDYVPKYWSSVYLLASYLNEEKTNHHTYTSDYVLMESDIGGRLAPNMSGVPQKNLLSVQDVEIGTDFAVDKSNEDEKCGDYSDMTEVDPVGRSRATYGKSVCFPSGRAHIITELTPPPFNGISIGVKGVNSGYSEVLNQLIDPTTKLTWPTCWQKIYVVGRIEKMMPALASLLRMKSSTQKKMPIKEKFHDWRDRFDPILTDTGSAMVPILTNNNKTEYLSFGRIHLSSVDTIAILLPDGVTTGFPLDEADFWSVRLNFDKPIGIDAMYVFTNMDMPGSKRAVHRKPNNKRQTCVRNWNFRNNNGWRVLLDASAATKFYSLFRSGLELYEGVEYKIALQKEDTEGVMTYEYPCGQLHDTTENIAILYFASGSCENIYPCPKNRTKMCTDRGPNGSWCGSKDEHNSYMPRMYIGKADGPNWFTLRKKTRPDRQRYDNTVSCAAQKYVCFFGGKRKHRRRVIMMDYIKDGSKPANISLQINKGLDGVIKTYECPQYERKENIYTSGVKKFEYNNLTETCFSESIESWMQLEAPDFWLAKISDKYFNSMMSTSWEHVMFDMQSYDLMPDKLDVHLNLAKELVKLRRRVKQECTYSDMTKYCTHFHGYTLNAIVTPKTWSWLCPCVDTLVTCKRSAQGDLMNSIVATGRISWQSVVGRNTKIKAGIRCIVFGKYGELMNMYDMLMSAVCRGLNQPPLPLNYRAMMRIASYTPESKNPVFYKTNKDIVTLVCNGMSKTCKYKHNVIFVLMSSGGGGSSNFRKDKAMYRTFIQDLTLHGSQRNIECKHRSQSKLLTARPSTYEHMIKKQAVCKSYEKNTSESPAAEFNLNSVNSSTQINIDEEMANQSSILMDFDDKVSTVDDQLKIEAVDNEENIPFTLNIPEIYIKEADVFWCAYPSLNVISRTMETAEMLSVIDKKCWRGDYMVTVKRDATGFWLSCSVNYKADHHQCTSPIVRSTIITFGDDPISIACSLSSAIPTNDFDKKKYDDATNGVSNWCTTDRDILTIVHKLTQDQVNRGENRCTYTVLGRVDANPVGLSHDLRRSGVYRQHQINAIPVDNCYMLDPDIDIPHVEVSESIDGRGIQIRCTLPKFIHKKSYALCPNSPMRDSKISIVAEARYDNDYDMPPVVYNVSNLNSIYSHSTCTVQLTDISQTHRQMTTNFTGLLKKAACDTDKTQRTSPAVILSTDVSDDTSAELLFKWDPRYTVGFKCAIGSRTSNLIHGKTISIYNKRVQNLITVHKQIIDAAKKEAKQAAVTKDKYSTSTNDPETSLVRRREAGRGTGVSIQTIDVTKKRVINVKIENTRNQFIIIGTVTGMGVLCIVIAVFTAKRWRKKRTAGNYQWHKLASE